MPAMKGLDPANLRANLRKTTQPDPAKNVRVCVHVRVCVLDLFPVHVCMILCIL